MWNVHVDLQGRNRRAAVDPHPHVFPFNGDLPGDGCENLLLQDGKEIGLPAGGSFVRQQDLQPLSRLRRGALAAEEREKLHAALRPNSLLSNRCCSVGMHIGTLSPLSRRAASR